MNEIKRPGAQPGNQNAAGPRKPASDRAESHLHIWVKRSDKARWVRAAKRRPLAEWVTETLNKAANSSGIPRRVDLGGPVWQFSCVCLAEA